MAEKRRGGKTHQNLARGSKQPWPVEKSPALKWLAEMKEMAQSEMRVDTPLRTVLEICTSHGSSKPRVTQLSYHPISSSSSTAGCRCLRSRACRCWWQ